MAPRSAKLLAKSKIQQVTTEEADIGDFGPDAGAVTNAGENEEAEGGFSGERGNDTSRTRPATKRAKAALMSSRSKKSNPSLKQKNRQKKSLSLLLTMPLDVLFEIFGFLSPRDIVNLARTTKVFRETLMSRGALTVWKLARERFDAPEPPSDMSEPGWAVLLFGNACQNCGAKNVQNVDFMLRRRLCLKCRKNGIIVESRLKITFPSLDRSILDLIPHTDTGERAHSRESNRFFWKDDVESMIKRVASLEQTSDSLEEFKEERKKLVDSVQSAVRGYLEWAENQGRERQVDKMALIEKRREAIYCRFIELGYDKQDVTRLRFEAELSTTTRLTDRIWQRIRPRLEPSVQYHQKARLNKELAALKNSRRNIVRALYQTYRHSLVPSQWKYLPRTLDICQLEPFAQVIDAPPDVAVKSGDFTAGMEILPELLSSLSDTKRKEFRKMLLEAKTVQRSDGQHDRGPIDPGPSSSHEPPDLLDLATSVLECHQRYGIHEPSGIVGVEEILTHHCDAERRESTAMDWCEWYIDIREPTRSVKYSFQGSTTASLLVQLSGLDPATALASEMDEKDLRFTCCRCLPERDFLCRWIAEGYSWRRAISHDIRGYHHGRYHNQVKVESCKWEVVSNTIAEELRAKEKTDGKWNAVMWTCGHCSLYMSDQGCRNDIIQHLEAEHAIVEPKEPDDLFMFERFASNFKQRTTFFVPEPED
ncbi:hypothetical protein GALMADRAFT_160246 [Galerina marginata CBS 339.88]|uniref:F-box domain-containing protein n=1 Tax=Galerina marginata (strain CBS 339.88) TaxID=685588 RepID=A0A067SPW0_GALM3|nr:hypothetical protein GALMADRAFT_160246 [Galerina marginata CBS 339.88]